MVEVRRCHRAPGLGCLLARQARDLWPGRRPEVVYGPGGTPLVIPIDTTSDELAELVEGVAGKYRLDPQGEDARPWLAFPRPTWP